MQVAGAAPSSATPAALSSAFDAQRAPETPRGLSGADVGGGGDAAVFVAVDAPEELLRRDDAHRHSRLQHCLLCLAGNGGSGDDDTNGE